MSTVRAVMIHPDGHTEDVRLPIGDYDAVLQAIREAVQCWLEVELDTRDLGPLWIWWSAEPLSDVVNLVASKAVADHGDAPHLVIRGLALLVRDSASVGWSLSDVTDADLEAVL